MKVLYVSRTSSACTLYCFRVALETAAPAACACFGLPPVFGGALRRTSADNRRGTLHSKWELYKASRNQLVLIPPTRAWCRGRRFQYLDGQVARLTRVAQLPWIVSLTPLSLSAASCLCQLLCPLPRPSFPPRAPVGMGWLGEVKTHSHWLSQHTDTCAHTHKQTTPSRRHAPTHTQANYTLVRKLVANRLAFAGLVCNP